MTASTRIHFRPVLVSLVLLALTACGGITTSSDGGAPIIQIARSPGDTVRAFLDAWNGLDYQAMYNQLSTQSRGLYAFSVFQALYTEADKVIGTRGVTYTIHRTTEQGASAAVSYDAAIQSSIFGAVEDDGRTMRLVREPDNTWRVAWSTMDIINGYATGTRLTVASQRPPRGNIYDRSDQLMVEQDSDVVELYAARLEMPDEGRCIDLLSVLLRQTRADLTELLDRYNPDTVVPLGDIDPEIYAARERDLSDLCQIRTNTRTTRRYIGHGIATHLIGYVGSIPSEQLQTYLDNGYGQGDLIGLEGIEKQYETALAGKSERVLRIVEPGGMYVRELAGSSGEPSQDVRLTLDLNLQWATAQALSDAYNAAAGNWASPEHSPGGAAVVIDVNTGAVLALASYPTFDPGIFNSDTSIFQVGDYIARLRNDTRSPFTNRATQEQYFPGSTFKIVTLAASAEEGVFKPADTFECQMEWNGREYGDSFERRVDWRYLEEGDAHFATGLVSMAQALTSSCNPFFYQMGALLFRRAPSTLENYARQMGLGSLTGFTNANQPVAEARGNLPTLRSADEAISAAVGQLDTQVTVIQMARMVAGVANGGTLYRPYVVREVGTPGSPPTYLAQPEAMSDMGLSAATLAIVYEGMCAVTRSDVVGQSTGQPLGTAWFVFDQPQPEGTGVAPYSVCAKTGTAQTARPEPFAWFVAYAPADNPEIAIAVMTEYSREGSETSAPIARRILDAYFNAPQAPWPYWWTQNPYYPLNIPEGSTGG